jgi:MoaA/NifB/PqqE/SkfB family radical SAM enzyme
MFLKNIFRRDSVTYNSLPESLLEEYNKHRPLGPQKYSCFAPFKSIYFGHHGKAIACCYNRDHILGEYPKQSIKEIWFGKEAEKLRDYIIHNDFSLGCGSCRHLLLAGNFDAVKAKQYDERTMNTNKYPSVMEFELSNVCNLECEMCSGDFSSLIRAKREKLPPLEMPYGNDFVNQLEEFIPYLDEVKFYGGEPFLIDIYYDIWERIMKINPAVRISVQTNATVLNSRIKDLLSKTNFHINVSFDSLDKETYESIRKNADFERVRENIQYFHSYCKAKNTFFGISVCAMQQNWKELPHFINFCNEMDVPVYFHTVFYPIHCAIRSLNPNKLEGIYQYLSQFDFPQDNEVQKKNKKHYFDFVNQVSAWRKISEVVSERKPLYNTSDLLQMLTKQITSDSLFSDELKEKKIETVTRKLKELEKELSPEFTNQVISKLDISDPSIFENMIFYLDSLPVSDLVLMAKNSLKPSR